MSKVAVVTGGNKGIGFAIVRGLCKQFQGDVYLTSRDVGRGEQAVKDLQNEGLNPKFHQLDVTDYKSIESLKSYLVDNYNGLDILINNAGIAYKMASTAPFLEQAEVTMKTNYTAVVNISDILFPILKPGARVVHVSSISSTGFLRRCSEERRKKLVALSTVGEVSDCLDEFIKDVREGKYEERGWYGSGYGASKFGVTAITPVQQVLMDKECSNIIINACCPGYVDTDMTSHKGSLTPDQGAETPLYLALLPKDEKSPRGCFLSKKKVYNWKNGEYPTVSGS